MRLRLAAAPVVLAGSITVAAAPAAFSAAPSSVPSISAGPGGCDPIASGECLLPFPDDWYTRPDPSAGTGRRVAFDAGALPAAWPGRPIDPAPWNRLDGFSPGSGLIVQVPGVDLAATGAAPVTDIGRSLRPDAPIVIVDATTGERWPYWAELDANATDPGRQALLVHPARNLTEGHRYLVALRDLKDAAGRTIPAPAGFARAAGPRLPRTDPLYERQRRLAPVLDRLAAAGIDRRSLYLAWDFTVADAASLTGDLVTMRDDAFRRLGARAPHFTITKVTDLTSAQDPRIAREVDGVVAVPSYLNLPGGPPGSSLLRGPGGRPYHLPRGVQQAGFRCEIPRAAFTSPSMPALYGHGLLGSRNEVGAGDVKAMAAEHDFTFCATDWIGMAQEDLPTVIAALLDPNGFPAIPDRMQQGMLNAMFVGRALVHAEGLTADKAFRTAGGRPLVDVRHGLAYDGNSQGGILGGALVAVSPDIRRGVLGVTGMNYSLLLNRSADFTRFEQVLSVAYPDKLRQQIVLALFQMLWDHAETDGYAAHLTDHHQVLMHVAFGDHQVANVAADVEARTIGARLYTPALAPGRSPDRVPYWGIAPIPRFPFRGSAMVVWDSGTPAPPTTNTAPTGPAYGHDPHPDPRNSADARRQKAAFLRTGLVIDVCAGAPCTAAPAG